jgi:putative PIN family toxin of toxin-antitoxin system
MPRKKTIRLVIDTNLWISFIISKKLMWLDTLLYENKARILFSKELIEEINETIKKPKLKKYFKGNAIEEMLIAFDTYIDLIEVTSKINICRDPNDNFLLALSKDGKANYLITGDKDLLEIQQYEKTTILKISDFIKVNER